MKQRFHKSPRVLLTLLLAVVLAVGMLPVGVFASTSTHDYGNEFKITYVTGGGSFQNNWDHPSTADGGQSVYPSIRRNGYEFMGWYTDSSFKNHHGGAITGPVTLYARWVANDDYDSSSSSSGSYYSGGDSGYYSGGSYYYGNNYYGNNYGYYWNGSQWVSYSSGEVQDTLIARTYSVNPSTSTNSDGSRAITVTIPEGNAKGLSAVSIQKRGDASSLVDLSRDNYSVKEGSAILTLKASYLSTLKDGDYTAFVGFLGGHTASFDFSVGYAGYDDYDEYDEDYEDEYEPPVQGDATSSPNINANPGTGR